MRIKGKILRLPAPSDWMDVARGFYEGTPGVVRWFV